MEEDIGLYWKIGDRAFCPTCVSAMVDAGEVAMAGVGDAKLLLSEPGMRCARCFRAVAREECAGPFEKVMRALERWMAENGDLPPSPEAQRAAEADAEIRRLKDNLRAAYQNLVKARNAAVAAGKTLGDEPMPPEA